MPHVIAPDGVYLAALGRRVEKGESVDVDADTARSLIEQGWQSARARAAKKAAKARRRNQADDTAGEETEDDTGDEETPTDTTADVAEDKE